MISREAPALVTRCEACGREFTNTLEMLEVGEDVYVHSHECEGFTTEATVGAPLVFVSALVGFFGGILLFEALGALWFVAVTVACASCVALAWEEYRRRAS